ncbi:uncharacterized protein [Euwallacea fornicatus]|uniref:uncharacterized protein n=1 Tax=Euwallacea fornicatus TaxID=995702 RepID=UPI00339065D5
MSLDKFGRHSAKKHKTTTVIKSTLSRTSNGDIDNGNLRICNLKPPIDENDATNKEYVDRLLQSTLMMMRENLDSHNHEVASLSDIVKRHETTMDKVKSTMSYNLESSRVIMKAIGDEVASTRSAPLALMSKEKIQLITELHKPSRRKFPRRRTIIKGLNDSWQADLAQMDMYSRENRQYKFFLIVIDCFSKYIWAKPLKSKSGAEVADAFSKILKESKISPKNLATDHGKEFYNTNFQQLMKKWTINHYSTFSITKAAIAERCIRTIKEKLYKLFSLNGNHKWVDILSDVIKKYNETKHSTTNVKPIAINKNNEKEILSRAYNHIKIVEKSRKFKVGDLVRISKNKHIFEKGYLPNWTTELFSIVKVQLTNPVTYLLEDQTGRPIKGAFYKYELQKTKQPDVFLVEKIIRKRGNKVYVKWLGFDKSHNSWISDDNKL